MRSDLALCFKDEGAAFELVQAHIWVDGVVCPHCGETRRTGLLRGVSTSTGTHKCYGCRKLFSVRTGTIFEYSHVPLHKWLKALFLTGCGTEFIKPFQLSQAINVSFKTAALMIAQIKQSAVECGMRTSDDEANTDEANTAVPANEKIDACSGGLSKGGPPQILTVNSPALASTAGAEPDAKANSSSEHRAKDEKWRHRPGSIRQRSHYAFRETPGANPASWSDAKARAARAERQVERSRRE